MSAQEKDIQHVHAPPGGEPAPNLMATKGSAEPVFDPASHFEQAVAHFSVLLDDRKIYGKGTVIEATESSRLRHLRKIAELEEDLPPEQILKDFNKLSGKQPHSGIFDPRDVAGIINFAGNNDRYAAVEPLMTALIRRDNSQELGDRLGPLNLRRMHALLMYAVDPESFGNLYNTMTKSEGIDQ
jgi:hypothetical protein